MAKITSSTKHPRFASVSRKDRLFEDFHINMLQTAERIENLFGVTGVREQVFGCDLCFGDPEDAQAKERLRGNRAWLLVSELFDYAVDGIVRPGSFPCDASALVIDAGEVIALLTGEEAAPLNEWHDIVMMGDGRVALDDGIGLDVERIALLANVDVRTVRNAMSSGALQSSRHDDPYISSESARLWLMGRKGFKPTVFADEAVIAVGEVQTADRFGALLRERRAAREQALAPQTEQVEQPRLDAYPGLTVEILAEAEAGVFRAPLSLVWPMADFYGIARDELLDCVMRVFFPNELEALFVARQRSRLSLVPVIEREGD